MVTANDYFKAMSPFIRCPSGKTNKTSQGADMNLQVFATN
jgi:hypothetical protein